ncbi:MAG TPA: TlpA disulfide reductase family protein [Polyangia bacterium]|nr:TlpA disulfide reductase family protein [Polyangia bacterium]
MLPGLCTFVIAAATAAQPAAVPVSVGDLAAIRAAVAAPGATAVLVNVWATWCDACREEMPALLRFARAHRSEGLRLVLVSADDEDQREQVAAYLAKAGAAGATAFIKHGADDAFVNGLDPNWTGALPASFLYDARGVKKRFWSGPITMPELEAGLRELKAAKPKGKP